MKKLDAMTKFGIKDADEFDTLLLDLGIDPDLTELTEAAFEAIKNHITLFASALPALPASEKEKEVESSYTAPQGAMSVVTTQGLAIAKETGLSITEGALQTICQMSFDKGMLDAAYLENAYWLGLMRQRNQLRGANTDKFVGLLAQEQEQTIDIEKLAKESGLLSNEELVKNLSAVAATAKVKSSSKTKAAIAQAMNW